MMRDQIADICDAEIQSDNPSCYTLADAIIAALPGMVKPLEWIDGGSDSFMHDADFVDTTQTYQIQEGLLWYAAEVLGQDHGSNSAAKAAAQADYARRIMRAFGVEGDG